MVNTTLRVLERIAEVVGWGGYSVSTVATVSASQTWAEAIHQGGLAAVVAILLGAGFWIARRIVDNWVEEQKHAREVSQKNMENNVRLTELVADMKGDLRDTLHNHGLLLTELARTIAALHPMTLDIAQRQKEMQEGTEHVERGNDNNH